MSKSKVRFAESAIQAKRKRTKEDEEEEERDETSGLDKKHTLDSDEEDEGAKYQKLDVKSIEGQEDATDEYDGGMKIMAFNMKDDMEEGHFDKDGTFIYNKKENDIKDAWLDNIDWENVKDSAGKHWIPQDRNAPDDVENDEGDAETSANKADLEKIYNRLLDLINDKETVAAALKRLNSEKGLSAAEERKRRWAAKKAGSKLEDNHSQTVSEITTLADSLISLGHMGAYQLDSCLIKELLGKLNPTEQSKENDAEAAFDMFGDELPTPNTSKEIVKGSSTDIQSSTMWEYKMKGEEEVQGPISTEAMTKKQQEGEFKEGASARRVGTEPFYDVKRIDFDLYE